MNNDLTFHVDGSEGIALVITYDDYFHINNNNHINSYNVNHIIQKSHNLSWYFCDSGIV